MTSLAQVDGRQNHCKGEDKYRSGTEVTERGDNAGPRRLMERIKEIVMRGDAHAMLRWRMMGNGEEGIGNSSAD